MLLRPNLVLPERDESIFFQHDHHLQATLCNARESGGTDERVECHRLVLLEGLEMPAHTSGIGSIRVDGPGDQRRERASL